MAFADALERDLGAGVRALQDGLDPQVLAHWHRKVARDAREMAPPWLAASITVRQDPILTMRFSIGASRRAVRHLMAAIDANLGAMPYSTRLYFLRVQESIAAEMDAALV